MRVPDSAFECALYLPRQRLERQWMLRICEVLWAHGMQLLTNYSIVGDDWNEQVHSVPSVQPYRHGSLSDQIDAAVRAGYGSVYCYDRAVPFELRFDLDLRETAVLYALDPDELAARADLTYGKLVLSIPSPYIDAERRIAKLPPDQVPSPAYLLAPYALAHLAMTHWIELLCAHLTPAFGIGYYATNSWAVEEGRFIREFDVDVIQALQEDRFPLVGCWLNQTYLLYAPDRLMGPAEVEKWLATPGRWSRRLPGGNWLAYSLPEPYAIGLQEAYIEQAKSLLDDIRERQDPTNLPEARAYLQRATQVAEAAHVHHIASDLLLSILEYQERQLKE